MAPHVDILGAIKLHLKTVLLNFVSIILIHFGITDILSSLL